MKNNSSDNDIKYESAFIIAFITASLYFIGYGYYLSFFYELSIPFKFLNIPTIEYITASYKAFIVLFLPILFFFVVWSQAPKNRKEAYLGSLPIIIFNIIAFIEYQLFIENSVVRILLQALIFVSIVFLILSAHYSHSGAYIIYKSNFNIKIIILIVFIGFLFSLAGDFGTSDARKIIENKDTTRIQLVLKDKNNTQIQDKELIFVMLYDNKYFVIEKNNSSPKYNRLYIIPNEEVEIATIWGRNQ